MHAALLRLGNQPCFLQALLNPGVAARAAFAPVPAMKVFDVPADMPASVLFAQRHHFIDRRSPVFVEHQIEEMLAQRIYGLALLYFSPIIIGAIRHVEAMSVIVLLSVFPPLWPAALLGAFMLPRRDPNYPLPRIWR